MAQPAAHPSRRRDKPVLSCTFCRGRKLRCDRQTPCSGCVSRGKASECIYIASEQERKAAIDYRPRSHAKSHQARQRLTRIENMVTEMKEQSGRPQAIEVGGMTSVSSTDRTTEDGMERLNLKEDQDIYTGSSHWVTILEDIQHLKDELSEERSDTSDSNTIQTSPISRTSLLSPAVSLSKEQILAQIPPRKVIDRLVFQFFNAFDVGPFVLHRKTFLAEYTKFWDNPAVTPITWIGLLFSVMSMSALLQREDTNASVPQDMLELYRDLTIQCLIAGDYLRPSRYTIGTLTLHFAVDQNLNLDASVGTWILIGVVIRLALRMGLHRDPSHWSNIRPLQSELRRRLWMTLYQMDFFTSTQVGLPRIIKDAQCDTRAPGHFFENDIGVDDVELPPERPLSDATPLLYVIRRYDIIKVAAEIYDATEAGPPTSDTIAMLDAKLQCTINSIPEWMRYKSLSTLIADDPVTIHHQISLDILIHKATYLLHRRSFVKNSGETKSTVSNDLCIQAALAILEHQRRISEETQPGGLMFDTRWKVATSLNQEFLQATMMLCFALSRRSDLPTDSQASSAVQRRDQIVAALVTARSLWEKNADKSAEARRAATTISAILHQDRSQVGGPSIWMPDTLPDATAQDYFSGLDFGQTMTLDPSLLMLHSNEDAFGPMLDTDFMVNEAHQNW